MLHSFPWSPIFAKLVLGCFYDKKSVPHGNHCGTRHKPGGIDLIPRSEKLCGAHRSSHAINKYSWLFLNERNILVNFQFVLGFPFWFFPPPNQLLSY